jgi:glyoxylase-like metal-dependent hydrolase (beta-lactamase superfamily II)
MLKDIRTITVALLSTAAIGIAIGAVSAAPAASPQDRVNAAYAAMGMTDVKLAPAEIVALVIKGSMQAWDPGESESVNDPYKPDWGISTFTESWDGSRGLYRIDWDRPRANGQRRVYTEIFTDEYGNKMGGYVTGVDVNGGQPARAVTGPNNQPLHTMSGARLTAELRELERDNVVAEMHDNPGRVSAIADQQAAGRTYPAVQYRGDYGTFIVLFDPASNLPAVVRTRDFDYYAADCNYDETLSDWREVANGVKMPYHRVIAMNGTKIFDTTISNIAFNPQIAADAFTVPAVLRRKAAQPAPADSVKWQWILRRMGNGFYADWDSYYTDEGSALKIQEVAPNISFINGGSHNTLIVATSDGLIAVEAPGDDGQSKIVMDLAQQKYPGRQWKYLLLTHHHIDHVGGLRAFAAAGATVVVGKGDGDFYRTVLSAPQTLNPYGTKSVPPKVEEVDGKWSVTEGGRTIEAYSLDNPHATGYIIPYVPDAKFGFVTDIWSPAPMIPPANPQTIALVKGIQKMGIQMDRMAGGHGGIGNYADLVKTIPN